MRKRLWKLVTRLFWLACFGLVAYYAFLAAQNPEVVKAPEPITIVVTATNGAETFVSTSIPPTETPAPTTTLPAADFNTGPTITPTTTLTPTEIVTAEVGSKPIETPTATLPTETPIPEPTATPIPFSIDGLANAYGAQLGALRTDGVYTDLPIAVQPFKDGFAIWLKLGDAQQIFFLSNDQHQVFSFADEWRDGMAESSCAKAQDQTFPVIRGFGKIWCEQGMSAEVGNATGKEMGGIGTLNVYEHGSIMKTKFDENGAENIWLVLNDNQGWTVLSK
jgi:hypothetical protein